MATIFSVVRLMFTLDEQGKTELFDCCFISDDWFNVQCCPNPDIVTMAVPAISWTPPKFPMRNPVVCRSLAIAASLIHSDQYFSKVQQTEVIRMSISYLMRALVEKWELHCHLQARQQRFEDKQYPERRAHITVVMDPGSYLSQTAFRTFCWLSIIMVNHLLADLKE